MSLFQYQALTKPVLGGPETVSVDRWLQPLSLPVIARRLPAAAMAAALTWSTFTPAAAAPATIGWLSPLSTPQTVRSVQQQSGAFVPPPQPAILGWLQPLDTPRLQRPSPASGASGPVSISPETTTVDRWQQPLSLPLWSKSPRAWAPFLAEPLSESPETSSLDRWYQPLSLPVRKLARPADSPALFWSGFTPPPPAFTSFGWLPSFEVPRLPQRPQPASGGVGPLSTAPETTTVDRWYQPMSLPVWRRDGVAPYAVLSAPPVIADGIGWFQCLAQPVPLSGLAAAGQLAVAWGSFVPTPPGAVSLSAWFVNLSSPYPASLALGVAYQQAYFSYVSLDPGTVIPTVIPGSVPGPSDGGEDERRRKWLEWSANRKRRAKPPAQAIAMPPAQAAPAPQAAPDILGKNVEAVRTQQDTATVLKAILLAEQHAHAQKIEHETRALAQRRQQEDDDEDDAFALFMDD